MFNGPKGNLISVAGWWSRKASDVAKKKGCKYLAPVVVAGSGQRIINNIGCTMLDPTRNGGDLEVACVPSAPSRGVLRAEGVQTCEHMFVSYCGVDVVAKTCVKKSLLRRQQGGQTVVRKHCIARVYQCYWLYTIVSTQFGPLNWFKKS